jgi:hypothetical protein
MNFLADGLWIRDRRPVLGRVGALGVAVLYVMLAMIAGQAESTQWREPMDPDMQQIQQLRSRYEARLLAIDGVVSVSIGLGEDGRPRLKIGTSEAVDTVRPRLPADLPEADVDLEYIGEIRAQ